MPSRPRTPFHRSLLNGMKRPQRLSSKVRNAVLAPLMGSRTPASCYGFPRPNKSPARYFNPVSTATVTTVWPGPNSRASRHALNTFMPPLWMRHHSHNNEFRLFSRLIQIDALRGSRIMLGDSRGQEDQSPRAEECRYPTPFSSRLACPPRLRRGPPCFRVLCVSRFWIPLLSGILVPLILKRDLAGVAGARTD